MCLTDFFFISMTNRKLAVLYAYRCTPSNSMHITSIRLVCAVPSCPVCYMARYEMGGGYTVGSRPDMWVVVVCLRRVHKTEKSDY
jgi:hypothetical protein